MLDAAAHAGDPRSVIGIALWEVVTLTGLVIQGGFIGGPSKEDNYDNNMGGGILNLGHTVHLIDTDVQDSIASRGGAGIYNVGSHGPGGTGRSVLRLVNSRVMRNRVTPSQYAYGGAGIYNDANPRLELVNATIENNTAVCKGTKGQDGFSVYCVGSGVQVNSGGVLEASDNTSIRYNHADQGGGLMLGPPWSIVSNATAVATLNDSILQANNATMYGGGAYIGNGQSYLQMQNGAVLKGNTAPEGHGKALYSVSTNAATYVVPAAPGYYMYPTFVCKERRKGIDCPPGYPCPPICNTTLLDGKHLSNLSVITDDDYPYVCPIGSYCDGKENRGLCPAGVRGDLAGNKNKTCGGPCPANYFCPNAGSGSTSPVLCPEGTYNERLGAPKADGWCLPCPYGHYCNAGAKWKCGNNTYGNNASYATRTSTASCIPCSSNAFTSNDGATSVAECVCMDTYYRTNTSNDVCIPCPVGAVCEGGAELATLRLLPGYWRTPLTPTNDIRKCPNNATCTGGGSNVSYCSPGVDPAVPYCSRCRDYPNSHLDLGPPPSCVKCKSAWVSMSSAVGGLLVVAASGLLAWRTGSTRVRSTVQARVGRGVVLGKRVKRYIVAKIKQALGFYQIVTHLHEVYGVTMPANFYRVSKPLNLLNFDPSDLPGLNAQCFGMSSFFKQLVARCVAPMVAIVLAFAFFKLRRRSFKEATPFVLWLTFLVFAMVSSPAFQAFSCEQFGDGADAVAYLRADYGVVCWHGPEHGAHAPTAEWQRIQAVATAIIVIYPVGVPVLYALLLFGSNSPTVQGSMGFLTDNYRESVRWWELAEVFKRMLLAGFFALPFFNPGTLVQLLLALMATLAFTIVQVNVAPFKQKSDHHFAVCANAALLFVLLCCVVLEQDALVQAIMDKLPPHMQAQYHISADGVSVALAISTFFVLGSLVAAPLLERGCLLPAARRLRARLSGGGSGRGSKGAAAANEEALLPSTQPQSEEAAPSARASAAAPAAAASDP